MQHLFHTVRQDLFCLGQKHLNPTLSGKTALALRLLEAFQTMPPELQKPEENV